MKYHNIILFIALLLLIPSASLRADDVVHIRLSFKIVLNAEGERPKTVKEEPVTNEQVDKRIGLMNEIMKTYFRGYRFVRVDPIMEIGGDGQPEGPSKWYDVNFHKDDAAIWTMEKEARNKAEYAWNEAAINIFITNGIVGGKFNLQGELVIVGGQSGFQTYLHEIGHFFNLCHTQGCNCSSCSRGLLQPCDAPGNDEIEDTLEDMACWHQEDIALNSFGKTYSTLNPARQDAVDNVFFNVMSYHTGPIRKLRKKLGRPLVKTRLTELQLDRWTVAANKKRRHVVDGVTLFVGGNSPSFDSVKEAVYAANSEGGDLVMLRPGAYPEQFRISKSLTLRGTRQGPAVIGASVAVTSFIAKSPREVDAALLRIPGMEAAEGDEEIGPLKDTKSSRLQQKKEN